MDDDDYGSESSGDSEVEIAELMQLDLADDSATSGKSEYLAKCSELKIVPIAIFIAKLDCEHINLRHHGMGVKGALSVAAALTVNTQIRSLNLGDNWLRDDGTHAIAKVLVTNASLTSLNLADNRIGLPGIMSICKHMQQNSTLAELSLRGNELNDRAAAPLAEAFKASSSLTKVDLSYNAFGEEAGKVFGDMLNGHSHLLDVNLKWNALKAKGATAIAEGLKQNSVLNRVDLGWNGLEDAGIAAIADMLGANAALTHLDVSHNRVNPAGCEKLAEGIKNNHNLLSLELGFNPMGVASSEKGVLTSQKSGITALIEALRASENIEAVGLSNVQSGGSYARGRASRFDPKNPDGHYALDLSQPWDRFIAETLYERMTHEKGESWINTTLAVGGSGGKTSPIDVTLDSFQMPPKGTLELDYVTWKRGLEATFKLDLANPCDLFIAEKLMQRAQASEGAGDGDGVEELRECKLNDEPFDTSSPLPSSGTLHVVYFSTLQQDAISFAIDLDLGQASARAILLRLWERVLTTPTDFWAACAHNGSDTTYQDWYYPVVPESGTLALTYCVRLAIKPYDRGVFFSAPMKPKSFESMIQTLSVQGSHKCSDFDKVNLIKQASMRNYFTSVQVKALIDTVSYRKGKIEAAVLLHPRTTDQANFHHALKSLDKDSDRQDILDMVGGSIQRKSRKAFRGVQVANMTSVSLVKAMAEGTKKPAAEGAPAAVAPVAVPPA